MAGIRTENSDCTGYSNGVAQAPVTVPACVAMNGRKPLAPRRRLRRHASVRVRFRGWKPGYQLRIEHNAPLRPLALFDYATVDSAD